MVSLPVQDSTISARALTAVLDARYSLGGAALCTFHRKGICDTYHVRAGADEYYLKLYRHGRRSSADVHEEVRLLEHLRRDGIPVVEPVEQQTGAVVWTIDAPEGERCAVLFRAAPGKPDDAGDPARMRALGATVARMHASADRLAGPYRRSPDGGELLEPELAVIDAFLAEHGAPRRDAARSIIHEIAARVRVLKLLEQSVAPLFGICHGDLHGADVAYDDAGTPTLFDFDSSGYEWRAFEIAVLPASVEWMDTSTERREERRRRLGAFLDGYSTVRSLSEAELEAVGPGEALRHLRLMAHVLRYTTVTEGTHWADHRFLEWHLVWFRWWLESGGEDYSMR